MSLILRSEKGSRLTISEMDGNLLYLEDFANTNGFETIIIDISSSEILDLYKTPIELLPSPGLDKYYIWKGLIEYTHVSLAYSLGNGAIKISNLAPSPKRGSFFPVDLINKKYNQSASFNSETPQGSLNYPVSLNNGVSLSSTNENPTSGNGTFRIKLDYKVITFGW